MEEKSMCELCDKEFSSKMYLQQHQMLMHGLSTPTNGHQLMSSPSSLISNTSFPFIFPLQQQQMTDGDNRSIVPNQVSS
jgi:hypothetical protein